MTRNRIFTATHGILGVPLALWAALTLAGCAHDKSAETRPTTAPVSESRSLSSGRFRSVVLTDVDADGHLDVVAGGSSPTTVAVSYGDGKGAIAGTHYLPTGGDVQSVAVADVDNDGRKDIVFSIQREASGIQVWKKTANRTWVRAKGPTSLYRYQGIEIGDVDEDGNPDIVAANATSETEGGVQVWLGDGRGGWPVQAGPTVSGIYMDVALADLNGDGHLDLAAAGWGNGGALRVWFGDGSGNWSAIPALAAGSFYGVRAADVDMDGHPDLVATTYRNGLMIFSGDGTGRFAAMPPPPDGGSFWDTLVTDLNADGEADLVAASNDAQGIRAWTLKDGRRWQKIGGRFPDTGTYYELAGGDLNGDGVADICAAAFGEGIQFWHGRDGFAFSTGSPAKAPSAAAAKQDKMARVEQNAVYTTVMGFPEYKIGPGDVLEITFWQRTKPEREEVLVRPDGKISFGFIDDLQVREMTPTQLDQELTRYYRRYVKDPRIDVVIKTPNSKFVAITGAIGGGVRTSTAGVGTGKYPLSGKTTLLEMVAMAGGPSRDANLREVRIRRKSGETLALNLYRAIYQGDPSQDMILDDGDLIYFPTLVLDANRVYVFGEVTDPGVVKLSETSMTLSDAILEAGGPTVFAYKRDARIVRGDVNNPQIISVDLRALLEEGDLSQNVTLSSGDFIYVPKTFLGDVNVFWKRVEPLFRLVIAPARTVTEWNDAIDILEGND